MKRNLTKKLAELARRTQECRDLSEIANYFHDEVATDALMDASKPLRSAKYRDIVHAAIRHVRGPNAALENLCVWRARKMGFVHGAGWSGTDIVAFFIFETLERGLAVISPMAGEGATHFLRLTVLTVPSDAAGSAPRPSGLQ